MPANPDHETERFATRPLILIVEDDPHIGPVLRRLAARSFPDHQVVLVKNGMAALALVEQHTANLHLVVLDVCMPILDGRLAAAQIRALVPQVPIMPFIADAAMLPVLLDLGCVIPVIKHTTPISAVPEHMAEAMATPVPPLANTPWVIRVIMAQQQSAALLSFVQATDPARAEASVSIPLTKADALTKYLRRIAQHHPSRQIQAVLAAMSETM
jgi:CheY-like chemotaxis protein